MSEKTITLRTTWADYLSVNGKALKEKTQKDYQSKLNCCVDDWMDKDMSKITKDMVLTRHKSLSAHPVQANAAMRIVKTLYNFALERYDDEDDQPILKRNPVKTLSALKAWNEEKPRERTIEPKQIKPWLNAVLMLENTVVRDYFILCLLAGFRHTECAGLLWANIDFQERTMFIPITKNGKPHCLPMSTYIYELLQDRHKNKINDFVFPGGRHHNLNEPMTSPYKVRDKVVAATGIYFTPHDLRRTFQNLAEELDITEYIRKRLMNHAFGDVTGKHYSKPKPEKLREPMEKISKFVLKLAELDD